MSKSIKHTMDSSRASQQILGGAGGAGSAGGQSRTTLSQLIAEQAKKKAAQEAGKPSVAKPARNDHTGGNHGPTSAKGGGKSSANQGLRRTAPGG